VRERRQDAEPRPDRDELRRTRQAPETNGRVVWLDLLNHPADPAITHHLGDRVRWAGDEDPPPDSGILILSPIRLVGLYHGPERYKHLRNIEPTDVIGHALLVYDLDALRQSKN
jgi:hypothetical protein